MEATTELVLRVRKYSAEPIPLGGIEEDTRFTDAEVAEFISASFSIDEAIARAWEAKAGLFQAEIGPIKATADGQESASWYSPQEQADFCFKMARQYREKLQCSTGMGFA